MSKISPELFYTTLTILFTALIWVPYIINRLIEMGPLTALKSVNVDNKPESNWACRSMAAHKNAIENLIIFAPLAIIVHILGISNESTATACLVYFIARVSHCIVYTFGVPFLKTLTFTIGVACQITLAVNILSSF